MKKQPTFTVEYNEDNSVMTVTVYCSKEESAAAIDLDISAMSLKLESEHYRLYEEF